MYFWRIVSPGVQEQAIVYGHHHYLISLAAVALAILAAFVALPASDRFNLAHGNSRYLWLIAGGMAWGAGIWAMHFTSMLAYNLPFPVQYDTLLTVCSGFFALLTGLGLMWLLPLIRQQRRCLFLAALVLSAGTLAMHFVGMEAINGPASLFYLPGWFAVSVLVAFGVSWIGLFARVKLPASMPTSPSLATALGSAALGIGTSAIHFSASAASYFVPRDDALPMVNSLEPMVLILGILAVTILLIGLLAMGILVDR
ncbi:MAG: hypothetical protein EP334_00850, partial [Gammaproteobacteria bacterium]